MQWNHRHAMAVLALRCADLYGGWKVACCQAQAKNVAKRVTNYVHSICCIAGICRYLAKEQNRHFGHYGAGEGPAIRQ